MLNRWQAITWANVDTNLWCHICFTRPQCVNSLAPGGFDYSLKLVNFKLILTINFLSISCEIVIRWMPQHLTDHLSTMVQVMAWCRQSTNHYLSQCWLKSPSPYDVTRPQWVKAFSVIRHPPVIVHHTLTGLYMLWRFYESQDGNHTRTITYKFIFFLFFFFSKNSFLPLLSHVPKSPWMESNLS